MAPTKKRHTRMAAAYDHLCPLGFSKSLIRSKVNLLLKVYGEEGWAFFEADAYRVLIEAILEEQETHSLKSGSLEDAVEAASTSTQQPNHVGETEHACTEPEHEPEPVPEQEPEPVPEQEPEPEPVPEQEREPEPGLGLDKEPDFLRSPLPEPVASPPRQKRAPCYGWISSEDKEDNVVLETEFSLLQQNCGSDCGKRKCPTRWDMTAEDMVAWKTCRSRSLA